MTKCCGCCGTVQAVPFSGSIIKGVKIGGVMSELFWWRAQGVAYICRLNARTAQVTATACWQHGVLCKKIPGRYVLPPNVQLLCASQQVKG